MGACLPKADSAVLDKSENAVSTASDTVYGSRNSKKGGRDAGNFVKVDADTGPSLECKPEETSSTSPPPILIKETPLVPPPPPDPCARMTQGRYDFGYCHSPDGRYVYVFGGMNENRKRLKRAEVFCVETQTWTALPPMERARSRCAAVFVGQTVVVTGGDGLEDGRSVEMFDLQRNEWKDGPHMVNARANHASVAVGSAVYVFGGTGKDRRVMAGCEVLLLSDDDNGEWLELDDMPHAADGCTAAVVPGGGEIYVCGGVSYNRTLRSSDVFRTSDQTWLRGPTLAVARGGATAACLPGAEGVSYLHLLGGRNPGGDALGSVETLRITGPVSATRNFRLDKRLSMVVPRTGHGVAVATPPTMEEPRICAFGGVTPVENPTALMEVVGADIRYKDDPDTEKDDDDDENEGSGTRYGWALAAAAMDSDARYKPFLVAATAVASKNRALAKTNPLYKVESDISEVAPTPQDNA